MEKNLAIAFKAWDKQCQIKRENVLFAELNNTYLQVERGDLELTVHVWNRLHELVGFLFPAFDQNGIQIKGNFIREYWVNELEKLAGWELV